MSKVEIRLPGPGLRRGQLVVDGHDITGDTTGFTLKAGHGEFTRLTVDLRLLEVTTFEADHVQVHLAPSTADLLERAGWTPPGRHHERLVAAATAVDMALRGLPLPADVMDSVAELAAALHEARPQ